MNDTELDELLNSWTAPPPPTSLRESVRAGFAASLEHQIIPGRRPRRIRTFTRKIVLAAAVLAMRPLVLRLSVRADLIERRDRVRAEAAAALVSAGCVDGTVMGYETILDHQTVVSQSQRDDRRVTAWMAPDLGCFALRVTAEQRRPDGAFRLVNRKQALKITLNP